MRVHVKTREPTWYTILDAAADFTILVLFIAYWVRGLSQSLASVAAYLFLLSLLWTLCWTPREMKLIPKHLTPREGRLYQRRQILFNGASFLLALPGYWFAGTGAFMS